MMRDGYFYKSLFSTLLIYFILICVLMVFVIKAGIFGIFCILIIAVSLFAYYYKGP